MIDLTTLFPDFNFALLFKIPFLVVVGIYILFTFIVFHRIRALNRIVYIRSSASSFLLALVAFLFFLAALSLFLFALVIL